MYCTHWPLSSLLDTGQGDSSTLFEGHTIGYKCVSNFQHNKYINVYSFLSYGYRNRLPGAPEFYLVCSYHCFLPFFFLFFSSSSSFHSSSFFFGVLLATSTTSASVYVCNSETVVDAPACDSKTSVQMMHVAFAETVDLLHRLQRGMRRMGTRWPITKLTCGWFWMWCVNFTISCLFPRFKEYFSNTTVVCATSYLSTHSYLAYWHNKLYDTVGSTFFIDFQINVMNNQNSQPLNAIHEVFHQSHNFQT